MKRALARTSRSVTVVPWESQLFQPIGGRHAFGRSSVVAIAFSLYNVRKACRLQYLTSSLTYLFDFIILENFRYVPLHIL